MNSNRVGIGDLCCNRCFWWFEGRKILTKIGGLEDCFKFQPDPWDDPVDSWSLNFRLKGPKSQTTDFGDDAYLQQTAQYLAWLVGDFVSLILLLVCQWPHQPKSLKDSKQNWESSEIFEWRGVKLSCFSAGVQTVNPDQLRLAVYLILYKVLYIPGGCLGFLPSTVLLKFCSAFFDFSIFCGFWGRHVLIASKGAIMALWRIPRYLGSFSAKGKGNYSIAHIAPNSEATKTCVYNMKTNTWSIIMIHYYLIFLPQKIGFKNNKYTSSTPTPKL